MTIEQQIRALLEATRINGTSYQAEVLENVIRFVLLRSHNGYVDFSIEDFAAEVLGE